MNRRGARDGSEERTTNRIDRHRTSRVGSSSALLAARGLMVPSGACTKADNERTVSATLSLAPAAQSEGRGTHERPHGARRRWRSGALRVLPCRGRRSVRVVPRSRVRRVLHAHRRHLPTVGHLPGLRSKEGEIARECVEKLRWFLGGAFARPRAPRGSFARDVRLGLRRKCSNAVDAALPWLYSRSR